MVPVLTNNVYHVHSNIIAVTTYLYIFNTWNVFGRSGFIQVLDCFLCLHILPSLKLYYSGKKFGISTWTLHCHCIKDKDVQSMEPIVGVWILFFLRIVECKIQHWVLRYFVHIRDCSIWSPFIKGGWYLVKQTRRTRGQTLKMDTKIYQVTCRVNIGKRRNPNRFRQKGYVLKIDFCDVIEWPWRRNYFFLWSIQSGVECMTNGCNRENTVCKRCYEDHHDILPF